MAKNAGLTLKEADISTIVTGPGGTFGAIVIDSDKGPLNERRLITSTKQFRAVYGSEAPGKLGHYSALAALQQGPNLQERPRLHSPKKAASFLVLST